MKISKVASEGTTSALRTIRILAFIFGYLALGVFAVRMPATSTIFALCVVAFVASGLKLFIGPQDSNHRIELDAAGVITAGSALVCGPTGAAGPAAMAALGGILLIRGCTTNLKNAAYTVGRLSAQSTITAIIFTNLGGHVDEPVGVQSFLAALAALSTYAFLDRILSSRKTSLYGLAVTAGFGYALSGAASALPSFAVFAPALPMALVLLMQLRNERKTANEHKETAVQAEVSTVEAALQVAEPEESASQSVMLDPKTGLANKRYLDIFMRQEISRAQRSGKEISILLIDIDDFTNANTVYGTEMGDHYVKALGCEVRKMVRDYDLVARYKEDELVVVLPEAPASAGFQTACRIHEHLSGKVLPVRARFSVGVSTYPAYGSTVDDLISSAHHALNRAKFSGKNSVRSCHELAKAS